MNTQITIIGTGYVGLVTGVGLAEIGHHVTCADIDKNKIDRLNQGIIPIYEPGLEQLVAKNRTRLTFTENVDQAVQQADVVFIAVGTPMADDGQADLSYIKAVAKTIGQNLNGYKVVVTKSTVPIGTGKMIRSIIKEHASTNSTFDVISNPEFLREGCAINDFLMPDRIVIGTQSEQAQQVMRTVYQPLIDKNVPIVMTSIETAEAIKYASNAFLAMKVAYINEVARLCDTTGADVIAVAHAMGLDSRISPKFLKPGPGFGGSCFPKDVQALAKMGQTHGIDLTLIKATVESNEQQKKYIVTKIEKALDGLVAGKTIALLGLAFKANTDDIRRSCAKTIIKELLAKGAIIRAYDPAAMDNMQQLFPNIIYCSSAHHAVTGADAAIILTEWNEFKKLDLTEIAPLMKQCNLIDTRNIIEKELLKKFNANNLCAIPKQKSRIIQK